MWDKLLPHFVCRLCRQSHCRSLIQLFYTRLRCSGSTCCVVRASIVICREGSVEWVVEGEAEVRLYLSFLNLIKILPRCSWSTPWLRLAFLSDISKLNSLVEANKVWQTWLIAQLGYKLLVNDSNVFIDHLHKGFTWYALGGYFLSRLLLCHVILAITDIFLCKRGLWQGRVDGFLWYG